METRGSCIGTNNTLRQLTEESDKFFLDKIMKLLSENSREILGGFVNNFGQ